MSDFVSDEEWIAYKQAYNKNYPNPYEDQRRRQLYWQYKYNNYNGQREINILSDMTHLEAQEYIGRNYSAYLKDKWERYKLNFGYYFDL